MVTVDIRVLIYSLLMFIFILSVVFIYLIVNRLREKKRETRIHHYINQYHKSFYDHLIEGEPASSEIEPECTLQIRAVEEILTRYSHSISSEKVVERICEYAETYLCSHYEAQLKSRRWSKRMNALYHIVDFRMYSFKSKVAEMLASDKHYTDDEYLQMYLFLTKADKQLFMKLIERNKASFTEWEYRKLVHELDQDSFALLLQSFEELPQSLQYSMIDIIGMENQLKWYSFLIEVLESEELELRIRTLKALSKLSYVHQPKLFKPYLQSPYWEERMLVARLLETNPSRDVQNYLITLLGDSSRLVRKQAAKSLSMQKGGEQLLQEISIDGDEDIMVEAFQDVYGTKVGELNG
ncbi:HEAT repeat domain-containing protein [Halalkalibacter sp. APA_J-10(15)]|uniref:HEAT repeat domain-containing protein n=1 Tax=unclassified Halalkalibacter TaxID=2893063 RepID=UPI001FF40F66|nr:HEAT repeat domain-containing protein [Halalkalibacter sp. APA_J-10(15)]MCK0470167.1 HEAT repeat domain-containing protein [Halalkalibacter sp. APA_J-10(15)]